MSDDTVSGFFYFILFFPVINVRRATFWKGKEKWQEASAHDKSHDKLAKNRMSLPRSLRQYSGKQISKVYRWIRTTQQVKL